MARILLADDDAATRDLVERALATDGHAVTPTQDGTEALEILSRVQPDLIFTDMQMPKMSGRELISALKSNPATAAVPIIVIAARASGFAQAEKRANFVIFKDIDIETQLAKALESIAGKAARAQAAGN